jgi:hypothetical protein
MKTKFFFGFILLLISLSVNSQQLVPYLLKNGRYSYVEYGKSKVVFNSQYDEAKPFFEGYACVKLKNKWGVINLKGETVIPLEYDVISSTKDGFTQVNKYYQDDGRSYFRSDDNEYFNKNFEKMNFKFIVNFSNGYAIIAERENIYIVDSFLNKTKLPIGVYGNYGWRDYSTKFFKYNSGFFRIESRKNGNPTFNYFNLKGKKLLINEYEDAEDFEDGLAKVSVGNSYDRDKKYGFIDTSGNEVIPLRYNNLGDFSEGLATANIGNGFGFINKKGEVAISFQSNFTANSFHFGLAQAFDNNNYKRFYIDKQGKIVITTENRNDGIDHAFFDGLSLIEKSNRIGYIDTKGNFVIPPIYKYATNFNNGFAIIARDNENNGKYEYSNNSFIGVINKKGIEKIPIKYEYIFLEFQDKKYFEQDHREYIFERSCNDDLKIDGYSLSNLSTPFIKNRIVKVELFGQKFYVDIEGHEYIEK